MSGVQTRMQDFQILQGIAWRIIYQVVLTVALDPVHEGLFLVLYLLDLTSIPEHTIALIHLLLNDTEA